MKHSLTQAMFPKVKGYILHAIKGQTNAVQLEVAPTARSAQDDSFRAQRRGGTSLTHGKDFGFVSKTKFCRSRFRYCQSLSPNLDLLHMKIIPQWFLMFASQAEVIIH